MLKINSVEKYYRSLSLFERQSTYVVKNVSFDCEIGSSIAIIGESGSGKSTLSRMILGIEKPDKGSVTLDGKSVCKRIVRKHKIGSVFQDYASSLHPFQTVREILIEVMCDCGDKSKEEMHVAAVQQMKEVGLNERYLDMYPHTLSGGEAQRIAIARALCIQPNYILFDEAISSLDMSVQMQILDLLLELRKKRSLTYIFITHDIQAATYLCDRIIIFKDGRIVEQLKTRNLYLSKEKYTKALINKQLLF